MFRSNHISLVLYFLRVFLALNIDGGLVGGGSERISLTSDRFRKLGETGAECLFVVSSNQKSKSKR
jgi:hypothetical protein